PAVRMTPAVDADEEAALRPQDTHELGEGVARLARRHDHAARDHEVRGAGANRQREVVALDEARAALRLVRPPERFVAQVDADHGAARGVIAHEPRHDAGAAAHIDDDLPRPRRLPDGPTEEARTELERGVKRRLEGVR